jgi:hypothetical protein
MKTLFHFRKSGIVKAVVAVASVAAVTLMSPQVAGRQGPVDETATVCFPTCRTNDARFMVVAGNDPTTFSAVDVLVGVSAPLDSSTVHFGLFDGDAGANWDKNVSSTPPPQLEIELWADPNRAGPTDSAAVLLKTYTPGGPNAIAYANNAWVDVFENHASVDPSGAAVTPFAYRYTLRFRGLNPSGNKGWNAFKLRTVGTLGVFAETFAFLGAFTFSIDRPAVYPQFVSTSNLGPSTYDGSWQFGFSVPAGVTSFDVWDGDFDFGNCVGVEDDDDANTPNTVPFFASPTTTRPEGVGRAIASDGGGVLQCTSGPSAGLYPTGLPMDDNGSPIFERFPNPLVPGGVAYEVVDPTGASSLKANPSGQREWERFTVSGGASTLPAGVYQVNVKGMDLSNLNFWRFTYRALGLPPSGPPAGEDAFYRIGRLVWYDTDEDGTPDSGEPVIPGVTVTVYDEDNHIQTGVTGADGQFFFRKPSGNYTVVVDSSNFSGPLAGLRSTTGGEVEPGVAVGPLPLPAYAEAIFGYVTNTPPQANNDAGLCICGGTRTFDVLANDTDRNNDTLTVTGITQPSNGTATLNANGSVTYAPTPGYLGPDTFTYSISDGQGGTSSGTVDVSVMNNPAVLVDDSATTAAETAVTVAVLANDYDPDGLPLTVTGATQGAHGTTVVNANGTITYTPAADFSGTDSFTYTVSDGCGSMTATVTITVTAPPPPGVCYVGSRNPNVGASQTWVSNANGSMTLRTTLSQSFNDNSYGANQIGWPGRNHKFDHLVTSDMVQLALFDKTGARKMEFKLDYFSASTASATGWQSLGTWGGDGAMILGSQAHVLSADSSLAMNFRQGPSYILTKDSPAMPNTTHPNWIFEMWYEVTVDKAAFGAAGFGYPRIVAMHASPSKSGVETEPLMVVDCAGNLTPANHDGGSPNGTSGGNANGKGSKK